MSEMSDPMSPAVWHAKERLRIDLADLKQYVVEFIAKCDAMSPEQFKTGQDHLPPAFREVNYYDAFMTLGRLVNEFEEKVAPMLEDVKETSK